MPEIEHVTTTKLSMENKNSLFGKYEFGKLLGCGAFAKVYHARNTATGQSVAVKVINKKRVSGSNLMSNITREVSIMRRLHHRHIVKLYEVLATKTKIYFVMEFVKGGELFAKVAKGRFTEDVASKYFQQLISAIGYCHSRGVFHRDLKPENLLIDENGDLKVSDFGLSALSEQIRPDGLLYTLCGTPAYVAPEILAKKGYNGAKVDLWSCGVILYVLTAGYLPFNDPNLMTMYKKIYKGQFRCPKWMSPDLKRLLHRLLDTNPETRITVDQILRHPWFRKDSKGVVNFCDEEHEVVAKPEKESKTGFSFLNAFDIISFSSGLDLSGLFLDSADSSQSERFMCSEPPERIMEKVEEVVKADSVVRLRKKKDWGVELDGQKGNYNSTIGLEIYRLTDSLVVVEARRSDGNACFYDDVWSKKIKPGLVALQEARLVGN